jgi:glutamate-1-semialdehyde 2,1-aminomutase
MSFAAMRAVLGEVLIDEAFGPMEELATMFANGVKGTIDANGLPWSISQLGARCEYRFASPAPRNGGESLKSADPLLEDYLHLFGANRGVLLTPFHNMALMCPATRPEHVERHQAVFDEAVGQLVG